MFVDQETMHICNYCGTLNAVKHRHHTNRCVDCGKLYDRYRKALRRGIASEIILCGYRMLARGITGAPGLQDTFYTKVSETVKSLKEEISVTVTHKTCKQCGRYLAIDEFRKYKPRGTGVYNTTQGHNTICKSCEAISSRASVALSKNDESTIQKLTEHYKLLQSRGLEPVTAPAKRLLGVATTKQVGTRKASLDYLLDITQGNSETELERHCRLVRCRGYASFEEADAAHRRLAGELNKLGPDVYEEINNLMDDWYLED